MKKHRWVWASTALSPRNHGLRAERSRSPVGIANCLNQTVLTETLDAIALTIMQRLYFKPNTLDVE
jgi:hypothetical protein